MGLKVLNAIGWALLLGKLLLAFGPAVWMVASFPSAAAAGCAVAWIWCILFTKPTAWWQKW